MSADSVDSAYLKLRHHNKNGCDDGTISTDDDDTTKKNVNKENDLLKSPAMKRKSSFRKSYSTDEDCMVKGNCNRDPDVYINKINSLLRTKENFLFGQSNSHNSPTKPKKFEAKCYIENGKINFGKMVTDEVLAADYKLVAAAKKMVFILYIMECCIIITIIIFIKFIIFFFLFRDRQT